MNTTKRIGIFCSIGFGVGVVLWGIGMLLGLGHGGHEMPLQVFFPWAYLLYRVDIGGTVGCSIAAAIQMPLYGLIVALFWDNKKMLPYTICALVVSHLLVTIFSALNNAI